MANTQYNINILHVKALSMNPIYILTFLSVYFAIVLPGLDYGPVCSPNQNALTIFLVDIRRWRIEDSDLGKNHQQNYEIILLYRNVIVASSF